MPRLGGGMEIKMDKLLKKDELLRYPRILVYNFFVIAAAYCGLLQMHFATDTYNNMFVDNANWQLAVGRYSIYVLAKLFEKAGISLALYQIPCMFVTIVLLTISSYIMFLMLHDNEDIKRQIYTKNCAILLCIVNVFCTELFLFPEYAIYYGFGILLAVLSSFLCIRMSLKNYALSVIILIVSLGFYQANIGVFLLLSLGALWLKRKPFQQNIYVILDGGIASSIMIFIQRYLVKSGITEEISRKAEFSLGKIIENISIIFFGKNQNQYEIIYKGAGLLPQGVLFFSILTFVFIILVFVVRTNKTKEIFHALTLVVVGYVVAYAPHLIAGSIWLSPRTIYPVFFYIGLLGAMAERLTSESKCHKLVSIVLGILLVTNFWSIQGIVTNHIATNKIDQNYAYDIYSEIKKYEQDTGIEVANIAPIKDVIPLWKNHYVDYYSFNINERAFLNDWSDVSLINYVSGRTFNKIAMDNEVFDIYFRDKDWDYYSPDEQLVFIGDTLYWCKY